jgi:hypothetical protein
MDALNRGRNNFIAGLGLVLVALIYYSLIYRYGLNLADEGNVAVISQRLMHGERPFVDLALGYNVLWFYPISALFKVFGTNLLLMRAYFYAVSTASGLLAFLLLRRLDAPLWLSMLQAILVILVTGQYYKGYIPFLVLANLLALTFFLTSQKKLRTAIIGGVLLGTSYLVRIDLGLFFTVIWCVVVVLHLWLLDRRIRLNLLIAFSLAIGVVLIHLPFLYDASRRGFLEEFLQQYRDYPATIVKLALPAKRPDLTRSKTPSATRCSLYPETSPDPGPRSDIQKYQSRLSRRPLHDIFMKSPKLDKRLLAFLTYATPALFCALLLVGIWFVLAKKLSAERWVLFSTILAGALTAFPQFFFFRPDLPHLIEFMKGGLVALTCAVWLLWSSLGGKRIAYAFAGALALIGAAYALATLPSPYGGTIALRKHRNIRFQGANGVDVFLSGSEYQAIEGVYNVTIQNTRANDYVACYPYLPSVNFMTGRRTFQNILYIDNLTRPPNWDEAEIARLQKYRPAVIVIDNWKINGTESSRFTSWATETMQFIQEHYRLQATFDDKKVFVRLLPSS